MAAARVGADAIGLVFYARSRRAVDIEQAAAIAAALPPFVSTVGLFVDPVVAEVERVLDGCRLDLLQFHGAETAAFCGGFGLPYLKAIAMGDGRDPRPEMDAHPQARGFLLDSHAGGKMGGRARSSTGAAFRVPWNAPGCWPVAWMRAMSGRPWRWHARMAWMSARAWNPRPGKKIPGWSGISLSR